MLALVVEDNALSARVVRAMLAADGWRVEEYDTLREARARIVVGHSAGDPADLLVVDLGLPDSEGVETVRALRQLDPYVAICVYTGDADPDTEVTLASACDFYASKADDPRRVRIGARVAVARARGRRAVVDAVAGGMVDAATALRGGGAGGD